MRVAMYIMGVEMDGDGDGGGDFRSEKKGRSSVPTCVAYNGTDITTGNPLYRGKSWIILYWKLP